MADEPVAAKVRPFPWLAAAVLLGLPSAGLVLKLMDGAGFYLPPCFFKRLTGLPCATCGMTRMVRAFLAGDLGMAFHWHPVAALLLCLSPLAALWDLRRAARGEAFPKVPDTGWFRGVALGLFLGTWALQIARGI